MRLLTIPSLVVLFVVSLVAQAPGSLFEIALSPGEGQPQFQAVATEIPLHQTPMTSAPITRRLSVASGQDIAFDDTRFRTLEPGRFDVHSRGTVTGRLIGTVTELSTEQYYNGEFPKRTLDFKDGDVIEYLQYRAEGTCFIRFGGQILDADPCPSEDPGIYTLALQPKTEWWIRVVADGAPAGWVMVDDKTVKEKERTF